MKPRMIMSRFGKYGQWGNQVLSYIGLKTYAKRNGAILELPEWTGRWLYHHDDPPISGPLPEYTERTSPCKYNSCFGVPFIPKPGEYTERDIIGWQQWHTSWYGEDKTMCQSLFSELKDPMKSRVTPAIETLRSMGDTVISLHLRRGDAGRFIFFMTPLTWPLKWLRYHWDRFKNPVLFLSVEDVSLVPYFRYYHPQITETLGIDPIAVPMPLYHHQHPVNVYRPRQCDFFCDWELMRNSDVILAAESTFSVTAAMMNTRLKEFWRPRLSLQGFESCDPWNMDVSPREHLDDFPHIPGTSRDSNPEYSHYWGAHANTHKAIPEDESEIQRWMQRK